MAAALFLLASPPFLKSALETIASKMQDIDLALLVGRLMENPQLKVGAQSLSIASSLVGVFGGGGGYAATGCSLQTSLETSAEARFSGWKPKLGKETQTLLVEGRLLATANDNVMTAISLLWLGKNEEAAWFLPGNLDVSYAGLTLYSAVDEVSQHFFESFLKI